MEIASKTSNSKTIILTSKMQSKIRQCMDNSNQVPIISVDNKVTLQIIKTKINDKSYKPIKVIDA